MKALKLSKMPNLEHLSIQGLHYPCAASVSPGVANHTKDTEANVLPNLLSTLESPFLRGIDLGFVCPHEVQSSDIDWSELRRTLEELCFFSVNKVNVDLSKGVRGDNLDVAKRDLLQGLCELVEKGIVHVYTA